MSGENIYYKDNQGNIHTAPPKTKKERINTLLTSLNQGGPIPRDQCIQSLFRELQSVLNEDEVDKLTEFRKDMRDKVKMVQKIETTMMQVGDMPEIAQAAQDRRNILTQEYAEIEDEILLILMRGCDRLEKAKSKVLS